MNSIDICNAWIVIAMDELTYLYFIKFSAAERKKRLSSGLLRSKRRVWNAEVPYKKICQWITIYDRGLNNHIRFVILLINLHIALIYAFLWIYTHTSPILLIVWNFESRSMYSANVSFSPFIINLIGAGCIFNKWSHLSFKFGKNTIQFYSNLID